MVFSLRSNSCLVAALRSLPTLAFLQLYDFQTGCEGLTASFRWQKVEEERTSQRCSRADGVDGSRSRR